MINFRVNVIHLAKMKTDIKHMERIISDLREQTTQVIYCSFSWSYLIFNFDAKGHDQKIRKDR